MSEFAKWREAVGLSLEEAAEMLGKSRIMTYYLDRGRNQHGPCAPQYDTRCLMRAIAEGYRPTPWPK
jgi:hypothetical protein